METRTAELQKLKRLTLDRVSVTVAALSSLAVAIGAWDWWAQGRPYTFAFTMVVLVGSLVVSIRSLSLRFRSTLLVSVAFCVAVSSFHFFGYLAIPAITMVLAVLLGYSLVGERFAIGASVAATLCILAIGALQSEGYIEAAPGRELYAPEEMAGWVRVALLFFTVTFAILRILSSQQQLLVRALDEQDESLEALRAKTLALEEAHEARELVEKRLREAERLEAIGHLAGSVAHDMNNTLTVVQMGAEELKLSSLDAEDLALVEDLIQATRGGAELCRQLLSCARRSVLSPRDVSPAPFLSAVARLFGHALPPDANLELDLPRDLPTIHIDEAELQHATLNLLANARDAIGGRGTIVLRASADAERVVIEVSDDGPGIPDEVRARVFEPLFTTKRDGGGSGLGLSSVLGTVTQAGGDVEIDTEIGAGTSVRMVFPRVIDRVLEAPSEPLQPSAHPRVLVVDDDPGIARMVSRLLEREGFEPTVVGSAEEAIDALAECDFHILLTDVVLPGRRGPELAEQALRDRPDLRVVLMTGYMDEVSAKTISDRRLPLLAKPFTNEELLELLRA